MNKHWESLGRELIAKQGRINAFTPHAPSIGRYHEEALKTCIQTILPQRFSLKTGFIHDGQSLVSSQCDIIIIDENESNSYLFQDGEFVIVHPDAVVAVIEVKTKLNKQDFLQVIDQSFILTKLRNETKTQKGCRLLVFAYDSVNFSPVLLDRWYRSIDVPLPLEHNTDIYPMMITSVTQGCLMGFPRSSETDEWGHKYISKETQDSGSWYVGLFLLSLKKLTQLHSGFDAHNPFSMIDFSGVSRSAQTLRYTEGLLD